MSSILGYLFLIIQKIENVLIMKYVYNIITIYSLVKISNNTFKLLHSESVKMYLCLILNFQFLAIEIDYFIINFYYKIV